MATLAPAWAKRRQMCSPRPLGVVLVLLGLYDIIIVCISEEQEGYTC